MKNNSFGENLAAFLLVIGVLFVIGLIGQAGESECVKAGCDNEQAGGSSYCYVHKSYTGSGSPHSSSSYSNKSSSGTSSKDNSGGNYSNQSNTTSNTSYDSSTKESTTTKKSTYDSYDDGYDDIYMDGDYDYDRYDRDSDYADGVDDAMDEFGEDW